MLLWRVTHNLRLLQHRVTDLLMILLLWVDLRLVNIARLSLLVHVERRCLVHVARLHLLVHVAGLCLLEAIVIRLLRGYSIGIIGSKITRRHMIAVLF